MPTYQEKLGTVRGPVCDPGLHIATVDPLIGAWNSAAEEESRTLPLGFYKPSARRQILNPDAVKDIPSGY